jgi:2-octaprenyl-6-methoxyphenol hydroxylase
MDDTDVLIIGGGLVGASLAIALDGSGLRVTLVEATAPKVDAQPSYDERNLALAQASVNALQKLDVWSSLAARAVPIRKIHVSRQGEFGAIRLDAKQHDLDFFGAVIPARELGNALLARLAACRHLVRHAPASLTAITHENDAVVATIDDRAIRARLIVGADGTESFVRSASGIDVDRVDYRQTAFVTTLTTERPIDSAYERFTASGPLALLPLGERKAGVVLTVPTDEAVHVAQIDDAAFIELIHSRFGWKLGRFSRPGRRVPYSLKRLQAQRLTAARTVLVGNAAQTLHPIAAQGFNLGLRDALTLVDVLRDAADPGDSGSLDDYAARRRADRDGTTAMSDGLARFTTSEFPPLKLLRSIGMLALDRVGPAQRALIDRGMGFRGDVPALALR